MSLYELLLFLHIAAAVVWIGSGTLINIQAFRAERSNDLDGLRRAARDGSELAPKLFIPASFSTLILGILLVIDGPWSFGQLWIVLGLVGIAATIATGMGLLEPRSREIAGMLERDGMTPQVASKIKQIVTLGRIDLVVLYLVIANMAIKPSGDDVGVLIGMAVILAAAVAFFGSQVRAAEGPDGASRQPASTAAGQGLEPR